MLTTQWKSGRKTERLTVLVLCSFQPVTLSLWVTVSFTGCFLPRPECPRRGRQHQRGGLEVWLKVCEEERRSDISSRWVDMRQSPGKKDAQIIHPIILPAPALMYLKVSIQHRNSSKSVLLLLNEQKPPNTHNTELLLTVWSRIWMWQYNSVFKDTFIHIQV